MRVAPVWIRLYSFSCEYWDLEILQHIGKMLGGFVKATKQTKQQRYIIFSHIYVYMDLSKELLESINLNCEDEQWK